MRMAISARTALGHFLILCQRDSGLIARSSWGLPLTHLSYQLHIRLPISQFLKIRSASDSDGDACLSSIAPLDFGSEAEGGKEAYKEISAIFLRRGSDEDCFEYFMGKS